jgi:aspartate/methionine/tyrosine aminotransferase
MKILNCLVAITLLGAASVAGAQINIPNPQLPGGSFESAVRLVVTNELMLDRQIKRWIHTHYPGWDADPHEFQDLGEERYAIVYITSPNNPGRRVYFRVQRSQADGNNEPGSFPL